MSATVLVTGATGYIAQHLIKQLLAKKYTVIGTVRSAAKGDELKQKFESEKFSYDIVKDIAVKHAFDEVFKAHKDITIVLHTASPFHFNVTDIEKELLIPAIEGTKNVLESIQTYAPQVEKVVVTSSYAAIGDFTKDSDPTVTFTEKSWNPVTYEGAKENPLLGYLGSKKFAEKAAWDFVEEHKPSFTLATVNPVYVFGPQAFDVDAKGTLGTSSEIVGSLLKLKPGEEISAHAGVYIDVRDVAAAHIVAFENPEAVNQRLLLAEQRFTSQSVLDIILKNFPELKGKISEGNPGSNPAGGATLDTTNTHKILGFKFIELEQSINDSIKQILQ